MANGSCLTYDVLDKLCVKVDHPLGPTNTSHSVTFKSGCFDNNDVALYKRGYPDQIYKYEYVPVEVRSMYDPIFYPSQVIPQGQQQAGEILDLSDQQDYSQAPQRPDYLQCLKTGGLVLTILGFLLALYAWIVVWRSKQYHELQESDIRVLRT